MCEGHLQPTAKLLTDRMPVSLGMIIPMYYFTATTVSAFVAADVVVSSGPAFLLDLNDPPVCPFGRPFPTKYYIR